MMDEKKAEYNAFWDGGAAALLLSAIIVSLYLFVLAPAIESSAKMEAELKVTQERIDMKNLELRSCKLKCLELENGDPQTIKEVARQELLKGLEGEFIIN